MLVNTNTQVVRKAVAIARYEKRVAKFKVEHTLNVLQAARKTGNDTLTALAQHDYDEADAAYIEAVERFLTARTDLRFAVAASRSEAMYRFNSWGERVALWWDTLGY